LSNFSIVKYNIIFMNVKTRLFSVILLGILIIPIFFNPPKEGKVLGVSEKVNTDLESAGQESILKPSTPTVSSILKTTNSETKEIPETVAPPQTAEYKLKDISSGIRDKKKKIVNAPREIQGKVAWNSGTSSAVTSDKFSLGGGLKVRFNGKETDLVITSTRILAPDVLLSVDQKTFAQLGGDLEKQSSIDVTIITE
jgi:hypothetical protein